MPNAQNKEMLTLIKADLADLTAVWVVDYRGLTVKQFEALRGDLREAEATIKVYKNTLMAIGLKEMDLPELGEVLEGPSAFIFAYNDPVASAKAINNFAKENKTLEIKGGLMDGQALDADQVKAVAALPSREELIAKLLGTISNPLVQTVRVLNGPMSAFARTVQAIADQKGAA